jgi:small subunit ribosomal protein S4
MRALGTDLPGLSRKNIGNRPYPPGQHGTSRRRKDSEYKKQLIEKQKLRFNYGIHERQLRNLMSEARSSPSDTGEALLAALESRLDNVVFRAGFAPTIPAARQLVNHGHIEVNGTKVDRASYRVRSGDTIQPRLKSRELKALVDNWKHPHRERPAWLVADTAKMTATVDSMPTAESVLLPLDINLVLEYYAKRM